MTDWSCAARLKQVNLALKGLKQINLALKGGNRTTCPERTKRVEWIRFGWVCHWAIVVGIKASKNLEQKIRPT